MKKVVFGVLTVLLLAVLATPFLLPEKTPDLDSAFKKFKEMDVKYNTDWKQEELRNMLIGYTFIDDAINELDAYQLEIAENRDKLQDKTELSTWEELLTRLAEARKKMLESEKEYHHYQALGPEGELEFEYVLGSPVVTEQLNCNDMEALDKGQMFLQKSLNLAHEFENHMDFVLQNAPETRKSELVGINEAKPAFYSKELGRISTQIKINKWGVDVCKKKL